MQRLVCVQDEKKPVSPTSLCSISIANPIIRPTSAPTEESVRESGIVVEISKEFRVCDRVEKGTCEGRDEHSSGKARSIHDAHE